MSNIEERYAKLLNMLIPYKTDTDRLTNLETGKPIVASKRYLFIEAFGLVNGELIGKKLEVV